ERQFDGVSNDGVRETTEGVPSRAQWLAPRQFLFNPLGKKWSEATQDDKADVTNHPYFQQAVYEYGIEVGNLKVKDAAKQLGVKPNTLSQRISRQELENIYHDVDFSKALGNYFCIVTLNGVNLLKILAKSDAPLSDVLAKFIEEWSKSESNAVKQV